VSYFLHSREARVKDPEYREARYRKALEEQRKLRSRVREEALIRSPRLVAGADVSFNLHGKTFWGGFVVCDLQEDFAVVDRSVVRMAVDFPYIPGLLGFREVPVLKAAYERLAVKPEVILVDAHGQAHPRRLGSASHLGVVLDAPAVGCAKSLLCGEFDEPGGERGAFSPLTLEGEIVGRVLRTRSGVKPVFVSVGHRCDLESATRLVVACSPKFRIPQPIRLAHAFVNDARRAHRRRPPSGMASERKK
jgi:deoxyribonuclease V